LTSDEIKVMEDHILKNYGVSSSQEEMMKFFMDERICGVGIKDANFARKVVGKKLMDQIPQVKEMFFLNGVGSKNLKQYIWDTQISLQLGYSFSDLHSVAYSHIALQEMNLVQHYPRIIWDTACLLISASADEENESSKGAD